MFDEFTIDPAQTKTWADHLTWGHIVLFRFPLRLAGEDESPKARPCLVLETPTLATRRYAVIAYGTSADTCDEYYDLEDVGDAISANAAHAALRRSAGPDLHVTEELAKHFERGATRNQQRGDEPRRSQET